MIWPWEFNVKSKKKNQIIGRRESKKIDQLKRPPKENIERRSRRSKRKYRNRKFIKRAADELKAHRYKQKKNKKDTMRPLRHPEVC